MVANIFEAHTVALFARSRVDEGLRLVAHLSLSPYVDPDCRLVAGQGLIGWVAREGRPLHVTHFDRDTRTLGLYTQDAEIKAFLAAPLPEGAGVLMVDSKNRYAFPENKQRILQDCATVGHVLWQVWRQERELALCHRWQAWQKTLCRASGPEEVLAGLAQCLMLGSGLVARLEGGAGRFSVVATAGLAAGERLSRESFPVGQGLTGWLFRHARGLVLHRSGANKERSYLLWPEEPFACGPTVVGIYVRGPCGGPPSAWVLTGEVDAEGWPEDVSALFEPPLRSVFSPDGGPPS